MKTLRKKKTQEAKLTPKKEEKTEVPTQTEPTKEEKIHVTEIKVEEKSSLFIRIILPGLIGFVLGILITSGFFIFTQGKLPKGNLLPTPTPQVTFSPTPEKTTATSSADLVSDLTFYDIKILNGSGKAGEAARLEKILKGEGFSILEIGNADSTNYQKTVIKAKTKVSQNYLEKLQDVLLRFFELEKIDTLPDKEESDVLIIVGSTRKIESTPSATPKL